MNSKEAFERIEQCCVSACLGLGQSPYNRFLQSITPCREDLEVLQQALDRLEQLEKENQGVKDDNTKLWHSLEYANNEIARLKKAIAILTEVVSLNCDKTLETERQFLRLSKEEYELLKEVLYDD